MTLYTSTVAPSGTATTLDMTGLLEHVRRPQYEPRHRNTEPHPALVALIVLGCLLICTAFWGLIGVLMLSVLL